MIRTPYFNCWWDGGFKIYRTIYWKKEHRPMGYRVVDALLRCLKVRDAGINGGRI